MYKLKVALSHDIDRISKTYQYFTKSIRAIKKMDLSSLKYQVLSFKERNRVFWNFDKIIELEDKYGVKSTHFFLFETIKFDFIHPANWKLSQGRYSKEDPRIIEIIRFLDENGWEVGLHGSFNSFKDYSLLVSEKKILENILGKPVFGVRQHYLNLDSHTWMVQKNAGFLYDSSYGYTKKIGFKDDIYTPFQPFEDQFLEIPLVIMDSCFMEDNKRWDNLEKIVNQAQDNNGIIVLNWHNNNLHEVEFPGYLRNYELLIKYFKERNAEFYRLIDYYNEILPKIGNKNV